MRTPNRHLLPLHRMLAAALLAGFVTAALADMELTTPDGRRVLLLDDQTWSYIDEGAAGTPSPEKPTDLLKLRVENMTPRLNGCRFGLRISNQLGYPLRSIVPRFSAYKGDGVLYESVLREFSSVKPTDDQYREITFRGIRCEDIEYIGLSGGDRCTMGDLNKYSGGDGECLRHVDIVPSDVIRMSK